MTQGGAARALAGLLIGMLVWPVAGRAEDDLRCAILANDLGEEMELIAVVHPGTAVRGEYAFMVYSVGPGGVSTIRQGGLFAGKAYEEMALSVISLGTAAVYDFAAELIVDGDVGRHCEAAM